MSDHRSGKFGRVQERTISNVKTRTEMSPWLGGSVSWSIVPYTRRFQVQFQVRAYLGGRFDPQSRSIWEATD